MGRGRFYDEVSDNMRARNKYTAARNPFSRGVTADEVARGLERGNPKRPQNKKDQKSKRGAK